MTPSSLPATKLYPVVEHREPGKWEIRSRRIKNEEEEVLFRVLRAGFCASDWKIFVGYKRVRTGIVPGHEVAVEVVYDPTGRWEEGQQGSLYPILFCGSCAVCSRGLTQHCVHKVSFGYSRDGGFAMYITAPPNLLVPTTLKDPEHFVFAEPVATVLWGLSRVAWQDVRRVGIWGLGVMGLLHALVIRFLYPDVEVVGWDLREDRRTWAQQRVDILTPDAEVDLLVVATGSQDVLQKLDQVVPGGQVLLFSSYYREEGVLNANTVHYRDLRVVGTHSAPFSVMQKAMKLLEDGVDPRFLISHRFRLHELPSFLEAYQRMEVLKGVLHP